MLRLCFLTGVDHNNEREREGEGENGLYTLGLVGYITKLMISLYSFTW